MNIFRDYADLSEEWGLGRRYFLMVGVILAVLMAWLFVWGKHDVEQPPVPASERTRPAP